MVQPEREQLAPTQIQNSQGPPMSVNTEPLNENAQKRSGTITIVIDKNEICNCSSPNEDVQIHITTTPETLQRKRLIKALSEAETAEVCSTKCNCCQQCEAMNIPKIQQSIPMTPSPTALQKSGNVMNFSSNLPRRQQSFYGLPLRNFTNMEAFNSKRSRSMSDFHVMRKMSFDQKQQPMMKMQLRPIYSGPSLSKISRPGSYSHRYPPTLQRAMAPHRIQTQRQFSFHGQPKRNLSTPKVPAPPAQLQKNCDILHQRPIQQQVKPNPVNVLENERNAKKMNELNRPLRKYSSFHDNVLPVHVPMNESDPKQSKQTKDDKYIGRTEPKRDLPRPPRSITERVLPPATFTARPSAVINNNNIVSAVGRKPLSFNVQETTTRNRFPAGRGYAPRINANQRPSPNYVSKNIVQPRSSIFRKPTIQSQQRTVPAISPGKISQQMVNKKQFLVQRKPLPMVHKKRVELQPSFNRKHQIKIFQPPKTFLQRKSINQRPPPQTRPMQVTRMYNLGRAKWPPQFILKKKGTLRPAVNPQRQKNRQPLQRQRRAFINIPQRNVRSKQNSPNNERPTVSPTSRNIKTPSQASMIPLRIANQVQQTTPRNNLSQGNTPSFRKISVVSLDRWINSTQQKKIPQPIRNNQPPNSIKVSQSQHQPSNVRRINEGRFQSSLPVNVMKKPNQIEKYAQAPRSVQNVGRPSSTNTQRMQPIVTQRRLMTPPTNGRKSMQQQQRTNQQEKLTDPVKVKIRNEKLKEFLFNFHFLRVYSLFLFQRISIIRN